MAKRSAHKSTSMTRVITLRPMSAPPSRPIVIRQSRAPSKPAKKHRASHRSSKGLAEKHRVGAIVGGAVLGLIEKSGIALPKLPMLGGAGTWGVAAWAVGKYLKSPWAEDLATGMLSIAAYEMTKTGTIAGVDGGGYVAGDVDTSGYVAGGF